MKKIMLVSILVLSFSNSFAFDWKSEATEVVANGVTYNVSNLLFNNRVFAKQFCEKIGMTLASNIQLFHAAQLSGAMNPNIGFSYKTNDRGVLFGAFGWESGPLVTDGQGKDLQTVLMLAVEDTEGLDVMTNPLPELTKALKDLYKADIKKLSAVCAPK